MIGVCCSFDGKGSFKKAQLISAVVIRSGHPCGRIGRHP